MHERRSVRGHDRGRNSGRGGVSATQTLAPCRASASSASTWCPWTSCWSRPGTTLGDVHIVNLAPRGVRAVAGSLERELPDHGTSPRPATCRPRIPLRGQRRCRRSRRPASPTTSTSTCCARHRRQPQRGHTVRARSRSRALAETTGADETSLIVELPDDEPGSLLAMLEQVLDPRREPVAPRVASIGDELGRYRFVVDLDGRIADERVADALLGLRRTGPDVIFLGWYPQADQRAIEYRSKFDDEIFIEEPRLAAGPDQRRARLIRDHRRRRRPHAILGRRTWRRPLSSDGRPVPPLPHRTEVPVSEGSATRIDPDATRFQRGYVPDVAAASQATADSARRSRSAGRPDRATTGPRPSARVAKMAGGAPSSDPPPRSDSASDGRRGPTAVCRRRPTTSSRTRRTPSRHPTDWFPKEDAPADEEHLARTLDVDRARRLRRLRRRRRRRPSGCRPPTLRTTSAVRAGSTRRSAPGDRRPRPALVQATGRHRRGAGDLGGSGDAHRTAPEDRP